MGRFVITAVWALTALPAGAASFHSIVEKVESELGIRKVRMPGVGVLKSSFVFVRRPGGASSLNFATFEGEMGRFQSAVRQAAGSGWKPMVSMHSKRDKDNVVIYVRADGGKMELLIATSEAREATLVRMKLDGIRILDWLRDPVRMKGGASHGIQ